MVAAAFLPSIGAGRRPCPSRRLSPRVLASSSASPGRQGQSRSGEGPAEGEECEEWRREEPSRTRMEEARELDALLERLCPQHVKDRGQQLWLRRRDAVLRSHGKELSKLAYKGWKDGGRGAVGVDLDLWNPSMAGNAVRYWTLSKLLTSRPERIQHSDMFEVVKRVQEYNPRTSFVLLLGEHGIYGVDVVRPSTALDQL